MVLQPHLTRRAARARYAILKSPTPCAPIVPLNSFCAGLFEKLYSGN